MVMFKIPRNTKKILIIRNMKIGDMIVATSLFYNIKKYFPNIQIDVLANEKSDFVLKYSSDVNCTYKHYKSGKNAKLKTILELFKARKNNYDVCINTIRVNWVRSFLWKLIIAPKFFIGFSFVKKYFIKQNSFYDDIIKYDDKAKMIDNLLEIMKYFNLSKDELKNIDRDYKIHNAPKYTKKAKEFFKKHTHIGSDKKDIFVLINISSSHFSRDVNKQMFIDICKLFSEISIGLKNACVNLIVCSAPNQRDVAKEYVKKSNGLNVICSYETKSIFDICALVEFSDIIISPDTSVVHIASAYKKPLVGLYLNDKENYNEWAPVGDNFKCVFSKHKKNMDGICFEDCKEFLEQNLKQIANNLSIKSK
jgi:ADP-heptose:LPS heptosyltransferase